MNILPEIEKAITTKLSLKIIYNGGSHPGTIRSIIPTKITDDKLIALCEESGQNKSFILSKIVLPADKTPQYADFDSMSDEEKLFLIYEQNKLKWEKIGWDVECGKDEILLFRRFKNGKRYKCPTYGIKYEPISHYSSYMNDDFEYIEGDFTSVNEKPWRVIGGREYKDCSKAISKFLDLSLPK